MSSIKVLEERYLKAKIAYYEGTEQRKEDFLTDAEFDALEKFLKENGSKVILQVGSKRKDFDFEHPTKMLSLNKEQTEATESGTNYVSDRFLVWYNKRESVVGKKKLISAPKFDGNAINIIFRNNPARLAMVLTRGDGFTGKDVSQRFRPYIDDTLIVEGIDLSENDVIEIRAEVVIKKKLFNEKYANEFANPRNYVAGVIGKDDYDEIKVSELDIIPLHFLINGKHVSYKHFLKNKFCSSTFEKYFDSENYENVIKNYEELREEFEYQLDGVVISFPVECREILGENEHDPEWALAIKFVPEEVTTPYYGIEWNISKRGEIIPTILLEPVFLDGSTVRRASGYNASYIIKNKIGPGAILSIAKAGDIIPEIQKVIVESDVLVHRLFPDECPVCGSTVSYDSVHLFCDNEKCPGRIAKQLSGALKILDIKGVGEKTIEPFAKDFENMYDLIQWIFNYGDTDAIGEYGITPNSRSHEIFVQAFKNIKSLDYEQVIRMLGYDNVGKKISTQLAREHEGLDYDYAHLERALVEKMRTPEISSYIKEVVEELERLGIIIDRPKKPTSSDIVEIGICMTGSPKEFGFKTKSEFLSKFPGIFETSLSDSKCQYLITDSYTSTSSKMKTATQKGIIIKTYGDFKL